MKAYLELVKEILGDYKIDGCIPVDPRHVLAWILVPSPSLSNMSRDNWNREVKVAIGCLKAELKNPKLCKSSEELAKSFGL